MSKQMKFNVPLLLIIGIVVLVALFSNTQTSIEKETVVTEMDLAGQVYDETARSRMEERNTDRSRERYDERESARLRSRGDDEQDPPPGYVGNDEDEIPEDEDGSCVYGDTNFDKKRTATDIACYQGHLAGTSDCMDVVPLDCVDINCNGIIDIADALSVEYKASTGMFDGLNQDKEKVWYDKDNNDIPDCKEEDKCQSWEGEVHAKLSGDAFLAEKYSVDIHSTLKLFPDKLSVGLKINDYQTPLMKAGDIIEIPIDSLVLEIHSIVDDGFFSDAHFKTEFTLYNNCDAPVANIPVCNLDFPTPSAQEMADDDPWIGNVNAEVVMVMFGGYAEPFSNKFYDESFGLIKANYIDTNKIKFVFKDFPLDFVVNDKKAAIASECAKEYGVFWEYFDKLFMSPSSTLTEENLVALAVEIGLNKKQFELCLIDKYHADSVQCDYNQGVAVGILGTPSFYINEKKISGSQSYPVFKAAIEEALTNP